MALAYAVGSRRLAHRRHHTSAWHARSFWGGWTALFVALISPVHEVGEHVFSVHMAQHLLMVMVAAPLLVASRSMPVLVWALPGRDRATVGRLTSHPGPVRTVLVSLTRAPVAWTVYLCTLWLWHLPAAYQAAMLNPWIHNAEHISFFLTALLFWWPVMGTAPLGSRLPYPVRMLYTFLAWIPNTVLGAVITFSPAALYPLYAERSAALGIDPIADQTLAGLLMWIPGDALFVAILLVLLASFLRQEEVEVNRREAALDRLLEQNARTARRT